MSEPYLTAAELGEHLKLPTSTILDKAQREEFPSVKVGRAVRFRLSEVEAVLEHRGVPPQPAVQLAGTASAGDDPLEWALGPLTGYWRRRHNIPLSRDGVERSDRR